MRKRRKQTTEFPRKIFERQAGILGKSVRNSEKAAHAIVNASYKNATYSDRIWMYQGMLKAEMDGLLKSGLIQGKHPRELAKHLQKRFGVSAYNANRLMTTELARVQTEAQKQSFERNGFTQYTFLALGTACSVCRALNEKHFDIDKMMPGENAPPMHPNCRCSVAAYMDSEEYEEWLETYKEHGMDFEEWKQLKRAGGLESDIGKSISEYFSGVSKQRKIFKEGLKNIKNQNVKKLLEQSLERTTIKRSSGRKSKYISTEKAMLLSKTAGADTIAHELFHEIDNTYGLTKNGMLNKSINSDYSRLKSLAKGYGKSIEDVLYSRYPNAFKKSETRMELKIQYRGISDIIHGCSKTTIDLGFGHRMPGYWEKDLALEKETFAQYGRIIYSNDPKVIEMFEKLFPNVKKEIDNTLERMIK